MTSRTIFLPLFVLFSLCIQGLRADPVCAQEESFPFLAVITGDKVNVRAGQSANFERLCQLKKEDEVIVVGREYSWYKIRLPLAAKSFVSKKYVQFLGQNAGGISASDVNIRAGAGIHHTILGQLQKGEQVYIQEEFDEWYRIEPVATSHGWIAEDFLEFKSKDIGQIEIETPPIHVTPKAALMPPPEIIEKPEKKTVEKSEKKAVEHLDTENLGIISVIGYVETYEDEGVDGIYYKIVSNGEPVAYIQGTNNILGRFIHHQVKIDGTVNQKLLSQYAYPVIIVLKVRLML